MIITLHTHHTNSTSTRKNGPRGLKFCMQPPHTILTTTQQNLTLLFPGGGVINPPPPLDLTYSLGPFFYCVRCLSIVESVEFLWIIHFERRKKICGLSKGVDLVDIQYFFLTSEIIKSFQKFSPVWLARFKLNGWIPFTLALQKNLWSFTLDNLYLSTILERACALFWVDWLTWLHAEGRSQKKNVWFARYKLNGWIPFTLALKKKLGFFTLDNLDLSIILERACALFWVEWLNCFHAEGRGPKKKCVARTL